MRKEDSDRDKCEGREKCVSSVQFRRVQLTIHALIYKFTTVLEPRLSSRASNRPELCLCLRGSMKATVNRLRISLKVPKPQLNKCEQMLLSIVTGCLYSWTI